MRRMKLAGLVAAALLVLAACGNDDGATVREVGGGSASGLASGSASGSASASASAPGFGEKEADGVVRVSGKEYAFTVEPAAVDGPKVFFRFTNEGDEEHELVVFSPKGEELGEVHELAPGKSGTLALELAPGTYQLKCLVEKDGKTHADLGMVAELTVR
jgi:plastocyanin